MKGSKSGMDSGNVEEVCVLCTLDPDSKSGDNGEGGGYNTGVDDMLEGAGGRPDCCTQKQCIYIYQRLSMSLSLSIGHTFVDFRSHPFFLYMNNVVEYIVQDICSS